jgi:hypothetical protein
VSTTIDYKFAGDPTPSGVGSAYGSPVSTCDGQFKSAQDVVAGDTICILGQRGVVAEVGQTIVDDMTNIASARVILSP